MAKEEQQLSSEQGNLMILHHILKRGFSESELRDLCAELDIDYEDISGQNKADKARELVGYCNRRQRTTDLAKHIRRLRPDAFGQHTSLQDTHSKSLSSNFSPKLTHVTQHGQGRTKKDNRIDLDSFIYFMQDATSIIYWFNSAVPAESAAKYLSCLHYLLLSHSRIIYPNGNSTILEGNELLLRDLAYGPFEPSGNSTFALDKYFYFIKEVIPDFPIEESNTISIPLDIYLSSALFKLSDILKKSGNGVDQRMRPLRLAVAMLQYYSDIWKAGRYPPVSLNISTEIQQVICQYFENQLNISTPDEFDKMDFLRTLCSRAWDDYE